MAFPIGYLFGKRAVVGALLDDVVDLWQVPQIPSRDPVVTEAREEIACQVCLQVSRWGPVNGEEREEDVAFHERAPRADPRIVLLHALQQTFAEACALGHGFKAANSC